MDKTDDPSTNGSSNNVHAAWDRKYSTKMITLQRGHSQPFTAGRHLGKGGFGSVHETELDGNVVALKRIWIRGRPSAHHQAEFEILRKMSVRRNQHVVEAIGFYILPGRPYTELGLLVWPVAQYDLARLLSHIDILHKVNLKSLSTRLTFPFELVDDEKDALEDLSILAQQPWDVAAWYQPTERPQLLESLLVKTTARLTRAFGCLARAVEYLHDDQQIRHKDLKPSQVLLSSDGLWVTDFGWSVDITSLSSSATSNGDKTTTRYHAPEREKRGRCGRSEDIFGLGCVYVEMALTLCGVGTEPCLNPEGQKIWSFQSNLDQTSRWLGNVSGELADLCPLIHQMLEYEATQRPIISEVVSRLSKHKTSSSVTEYFASCCMAGMRI